MRRLLEIFGGIVIAFVGLIVMLFSSSIMEASARKVNPGLFLFKTGISYVGGLIAIAVGVALITNEFRKK